MKAIIIAIFSMLFFGACSTNEIKLDSAELSFKMSIPGQQFYNSVQFIYPDSIFFVKQNLYDDEQNKMSKKLDHSTAQQLIKEAIKVLDTDTQLTYGLIDQLEANNLLQEVYIQLDRGKGKESKSILIHQVKVNEMPLELVQFLSLIVSLMPS